MILGPPCVWPIETHEGVIDCWLPTEVMYEFTMPGVDFDGSDITVTFQRVRCAAGHFYDVEADWDTDLRNIED